MKKIVLLLSVLIVFILSGGCVKEKEACQPKTIASEDASMQTLSATKGGGFTKHSSGMYYYIDNPGSGATPGATSTLTVKYVGQLSDGTVFDQTPGTTTASFNLSGVIFGWQIALPLIKKGGKIKMIIPSTYGYGCTANGPIPAYSILYFEVELIDVL